jgi:hypothetical protein
MNSRISTRILSGGPTKNAFAALHIAVEYG